MPQTFNNTRVLGRAIKNILVLGGGGVIGSALIKYLRKETPFTVSHVLNRGHHDLRVAGELDRFLAKRNKLPDFCFYLAYEVGGAKFINALEHDATIELYNNRIDDNVVATLERRHIPFLYASSRLAGSNTGYGRAKAYGERKVAGTTVGKTFRLWNIYGVEPIGPKAHVIPDWIWQCLQHPNGIVQSHANPDISRQFTHASDLAPTLVRMMASFDQLPNLSNLDSSPSSTLAQVARTLTAASDGKCTVRFPITATTSESINAVTDNTPLRTQLGTASDAVRIRQHHTMEDHIRRMMHYYRERHMNSTAVAEKRASAEPYLSIITAVRNDDFQGFGARFVHFVRELTRRAKAVNLLYELIIVQCNPRIAPTKEAYTKANYDDDLPISMRFLFTNDTVDANLRFITIDPAQYPFRSTKFVMAEYLAKNVAALRARAPFLLFLNADIVLPESLLEWFARMQITPGRAFRSARMGVATPRTGTDGVDCDRESEGVVACSEKGLCTDAQRSDPLAKRVREVHRRAMALGDFMLVPRNLFLSLRGFAEIAGQSIGVDVAFLKYVENKAPRVKWEWTDAGVCHLESKSEQQARALQDASPFGDNVRMPNSAFGMRDVALPSAETASYMDFAYNPDTPWVLYRHHDALAPFVAKRVTAPLDPRFLLDFVGTRTAYEFDCDNWNRYRRHHMSRRIPCDRHDFFVVRQFAGSPALGELPVVDEEYFGWISLLLAVRRFTERRDRKKFTAVELGARYGTWIARAARAVMLIGVAPEDIRLLGVEGDTTGFSWMQRHMQTNAQGTAFTLRNALFGPKKGMSTKWERGSESISIDVLTMQDILKPYADDIVDIVHVDVQGSEKHLLSHAVMECLNQHVLAMHIGTHSAALHQDVIRRFTESGWIVLHQLDRKSVV